MKIYRIEKENWASAVQSLHAAYQLFGPVEDGGFHNFKNLEAGDVPDLNFGNTRLSAKALVHPQSQLMFEYSLDENEKDHHVLKEIDGSNAKRAVVGIRPCDADAFLLVKRNFDSPEYKDPFWLNAYEATTFIGLACDAPCPTCFCTTAGSGPFSETGLDALLMDAGDHYLAKSITEKGEAFLTAGGFTPDTDADETVDGMRTAAEEKIASKVSTDQLANKVTTELYDAPFWEDVAFSCINCGTCTYLCPTCWCFDIQDENFGKSGVRMRNWDSCMFPLFSLHGSGHNPRGQKVQRVRQRFMHKLKYYVDKYNSGIQCVGCGRCIRHCPVNIDIRNVCGLMNSFGEAAAACEVK